MRKPFGHSALLSDIHIFLYISHITNNEISEQKKKYPYTKKKKKVDIIYNIIDVFIIFFVIVKIILYSN